VGDFVGARENAVEKLKQKTIKVLSQLKKAKS